MSALIVARGISHEFASGRELFRDLSFSLAEGITALVGPNGAGKSCLARILAGELTPTAGVIQRHVPVRYFAQRESRPSVSVAEYLADRYEWSPLLQRLLADIDLALPCTTLSGGQWMRVRLARELSDDYLILDEPSNDLDRDGRDGLTEFLRGRRGGVLLISHDRECLHLCNEVLELSNRGLARFGGGWDEYTMASQQERARLHAQLEQAKREREAANAARAEQLARQEKRNRRGSAVARRGGAPAILLGSRKRRAQVSTGKIETASLTKANQAVREAHAAYSALKIDPAMYADVMGRPLPAQRLIAAAHGFNVRFADWLYASDLEFEWRGSARIALTGPNGSGKSTLLEALMGATFTTRGELRRGQLVTLYVDQQCRQLDESLTVFDTVRAVAAGTDRELRNGLARFLFQGDSVFQRVSELSGGERLRAVLARGFLAVQQPELLLLDEPTNNLDLANVEFLAAVAREFRGALVVVSHDLSFVAECNLDEELALPAQHSR